MGRMGIRKKAVSTVGSALAPRAIDLAPGLTTSFVQQAMHRAIVGVGPLVGAAQAAEKQLREQGGNAEKAVKEVIENHVRYAAAGGFTTNVGGLVTAAVTIPANITGLTVIQCRMVAGIAHLRGYDLDDPRVRNALLVLLLGEEKVNKQVARKKLPAPPMAIATAPTHDAHLDTLIAAEVASDLLTRIAGKRLATTVGKRVPVVGGVVGASADGFVTYKIGKYAAQELLPRARR